MFSCEICGTFNSTVFKRNLAFAINVTRLFYSKIFQIFIFNLIDHFEGKSFTIKNTIYHLHTFFNARTIFFFLSRFSFTNIHESQESSYCRELRRCFQRIGNILADCILAFSKFKPTFFGWIYHCCFFPQCLKIFVKLFSQSLFINDNFTFEKNYVFITWNRYFSCILFSTNANKYLPFMC